MIRKATKKINNNNNNNNNKIDCDVESRRVIYNKKLTIKQNEDEDEVDEAAKLVVTMLEVGRVRVKLNHSFR
jgi:hypothetical protein